MKENNNYFFYYKDNKRNIVPVEDEKKNEEAKIKIKEILEEHKQDLPKEFRKNIDKLKLYSPKGDIKRAHALILNVEDGAYDLKNKLNCMTGKENAEYASLRYEMILMKLRFVVNLPYFIE